MRIFALIASAALLTIGGGVSAAAQCVIFDPAAAPDIRVDPLDASGSAQIMQPLNLTVRRSGTDSAPIKVLYQVVDEDSPIRPRVGTTGGPQIEWRSTDSSRNIGATRNETYALLRSGVVDFGAGEMSKQIGLRIFVENLQDDLPSGVYREHYSLRFWCSDTGESSSYDIPGSISVAIQVPNVLSANIAGGSNNGEIDFLDFSTLSRSLAISVRSTGGYEISVRSENSGVMRREGPASINPNEVIPYRVSFGGTRLPLGEQAGFYRTRAGLVGQQIPLDVEVDDVGTKRAGVYRDTIVLTLAPAS